MKLRSGWRWVTHNLTIDQLVFENVVKGYTVKRGLTGWDVWIGNQHIDHCEDRWTAREELAHRLKSATNTQRKTVAEVRAQTTSAPSELSLLQQ